MSSSKERPWLISSSSFLTSSNSYRADQAEIRKQLCVSRKWNPFATSLSWPLFRFENVNQCLEQPLILTWYTVEAAWWGAYEAGRLKVGITLVIAGCVTSWQSSVDAAHCRVTGWHIGRAPRRRIVQQTPYNKREGILVNYAREYLDNWNISEILEDLFYLWSFRFVFMLALCFIA